MANKFKKVLTLSAAMLALGLASCDTVEAKLPADEKVLTFEDGKDVYNNQLSKIYDALVNGGDTNSQRVLNNILYLYSEAVFGSFYDEMDGTNVKNYGIKSAVEGGEAGAAFASYIKDHKAMQVLKESGDIDMAKSFIKVKNMYAEILGRIYKLFYSYVLDASYQDRSRFCEEKFYQAQVKNYFDLGTAYYTTDEANYYVPVNGAFRLDDTYTADDQLNDYFKDLFATYKNYIELNILPDIYRSELTAQYLYTQNIYQIRNTMARKIDYVALSENNDYNGKVKDLMNAYCKLIVNTGKQDTYDFTWLDRVNKGAEAAIIADTQAQALYAEAGWTLKSITVGGQNYDYYAESVFGTTCLKYQKVLDKTTRDESELASIESEFTGSGSHTKETGFKIKLNELLADNNTEYDWYTSGSLNGIPSDMANRAFKIQVANELDDNNATERYLKKVADDGATTKNAYLMPANYETGTEYPYLVQDSGKYYIVKVEEATKAAKLNSNYADDYYGDEKAEMIARKIAYSLSSSDTWKKAANTYYVEQMAAIFHDDYVLEYFEHTFPEIFDN
ncbi:MAG: hypothetical protein K6F36_04040 [Bacilli bacterium]|nr:hypothetical protein [Bacilli bacterium]